MHCLLKIGKIFKYIEVVEINKIKTNTTFNLNNTNRNK